jgi:hypothetical protein
MMILMTLTRLMMSLKPSEGLRGLKKEGPKKRILRSRDCLDKPTAKAESSRRYPMELCMGPPVSIFDSQHQLLQMTNSTSELSLYYCSWQNRKEAIIYPKEKNLRNIRWMQEQCHIADFHGIFVAITISSFSFLDFGFLRLPNTSTSWIWLDNGYPANADNRLCSSGSCFGVPEVWFFLSLVTFSFWLQPCMLCELFNWTKNSW